MDHLEAQSLINAFIDHKIPSDKQEDFVMHMKNCPECHKELEIYYTLLVGMSQIDNGEELCADFDAELDRNLERMKGRSRGRRRALVSSFTFIMLAIVALMTVFYLRSLSKVYIYEQETKTITQGDDYFFRELGNYIGVNDRLIEEVELIEYKNDTDRFYQTIHYTNCLLEANETLLRIGEEIEIEQTTID